MNARLHLLSDWQHNFPLTSAPFADIARSLDLTEAEVLTHYRQAQADGALSRIGGVFAPGSGGDSLLAAMAVPPERLGEVAALVSQQPGVNHNYAREHRINLWFVMTGPSREAVEHSLQTLEKHTGHRILRLRLLRPYRIDLGFALGQAVSPQAMRPLSALRPTALPCADHALAALVEAGLPIEAHPYAGWSQQLGRSEAGLLQTLNAWLQAGQLLRFGVVVRHHELGYAANAMTVFDVPDEVVDACGQALAVQAGVTLAYRRNREDGWPYNLYAMVHGQQRQAVLQVVEGMTEAAGLSGFARQVLFSTHRYKQTGGRRFTPFPVAHPTEAAHAACG